LPQARRTVYAFFYFRDGRFFDVGLLLRGTAKAVSTKQVLAISILAGEEFIVSEDDVGLFRELPSDRWVEVGADERVLSLARKGLVLVDIEKEPFTTFRARDEEFAANQWNIYGALQHSMTKWGGIDFRGDLREIGAALEELPVVPEDVLEAYIRDHGPPPPTFHARSDALAMHPLPAVDSRGPLQELLARRKTTRAWDRSTPMTEAELATVLDAAFGVRGYAPILPGLVGLHKASPSGGGLHPTEAYPLVTAVEGVEPGLYHYRAEDGALELLERIPPEEGVELATRFTCGQSYFGSAHVTVILAARFYRSFWKYRRHQRAYGALLMDAAHLSQTHYLVCAELGLGAFVTFAINGVDIEERLGLDGVAEGAVLVCGCGRPASESPLDPTFLPYVPGETEI